MLHEKAKAFMYKIMRNTYTYLSLIIGLVTAGIGIIQLSGVGLALSDTIVGLGFLALGTVLMALFWNSKQLVADMNQTREETKTLEQEKEEAIAESMAKTRFLANVSHELRTPLNAIIGFSDLLKDEVMGPLGNQQYVAYVNDIHTSGVHLLGIINDILDFSKAEAGKLEMNVMDVDVTKLLRNAVRMVSPRAGEGGVEFVEELPEEHIVMPTDGKRFKQIMLNLLSNAVKFTEEGGKVTIHAQDIPEEDVWMIRVSDTGVGIAPQDIEKVFSSFGQIDGELSRKYEGTGLGLPLTKLLVELLGGTLKLESELGKGTSVTVKLPKTFTQEEVGEADLTKHAEDAQMDSETPSAEKPAAA